MSIDRWYASCFPFHCGRSSDGESDEEGSFRRVHRDARGGRREPGGISRDSRDRRWQYQRARPRGRRHCAAAAATRLQGAGLLRRDGRGRAAGDGPGRRRGRVRHPSGRRDSGQAHRAFRHDQARQPQVRLRTARGERKRGPEPGDAVWHELLGSREQKVTVAPGQTTTVDFELHAVAPEEH